jgi:C1A family cysteine protease
MPRLTYGTVRDTYDARDHRYSPSLQIEQLPSSTDLRPYCSPVYDQGTLGSCTANSIAFILEYAQIREKAPTIFTPSRLFIYYLERDAEGTVGSDEGAQIRDGIRAVATSGAAPESLWPYDITKFAERPPAEVYSAASQHQAIRYQRVDQDIYHLKEVLASGYPISFGFSVYSAFESPEVAASGILDMPSPDEQYQGGHAVALVGYDDSTQRFTVRNSWGTGWGQAGYFTIPYGYVTNNQLASDFWSISYVTDN